MADFQYAQGQVAGTGDMSIDKGLRGFMLGVYNKMGLGLVLSAILACAGGSGQIPGVTESAFGSAFVDVVMLGPIAILLISSFAMRNPSPLASGIIYWSVVSLIGLSLGYWLIVAKLSPTVDFTTIAKAF